jgi:hypothetical protein
VIFAVDSSESIQNGKRNWELNQTIEVAFARDLQTTSYRILDPETFLN